MTIKYSIQILTMANYLGPIRLLTTYHYLKKNGLATTTLEQSSKGSNNREIIDRKKNISHTNAA